MVSDECEPAEGVRWIKAPSDDELSEYLARAWAFCMPSTYEGFGLPYLEAMAYGVPVVATPNPGAHMLLGEGLYGIVADEHELGDRLVEVLRDGALRESLSHQGRLRADEYSWERCCERHEVAYGQAIERWRSSSRRR